MKPSENIKNKAKIIMIDKELLKSPETAYIAAILEWLDENYETTHPQTSIL